MKPSEVLQIRIELMDVTPAIWRRIQVAAPCTLWDLHVAIQDAMGWTDSHLHAFRVPGPDGKGWRHFGIPDEEMLDDIEPDWEHEVTDVVSIRQPRIEYEYDFGDGWCHGVVLEDVLPSDGGAYPRCVAGQRACPPEDVGGPPGYEGFLEAIADPDHEEHDEYLEWIGGPFDPEDFDAAQVAFEDPEARWQEVFGEDGLGLAAAMPPPLVEGGFTPEEMHGLLLEPLGEGSPLELATDLPEEAWQEAPLVRDMGTYLRLVAEKGSLKLTKKGNLPRVAVTHLFEAGALGTYWLWEEHPPKNEDDAARATHLRQFGDMTGWTKKRKGKLELTRKGQAVASGKMPGHAVFRRLFEEYVTRYNWGYTDLMPDTPWFRAGFGYVLWLLQEYGDEKRASTFYADRFRAAFPHVMGDFPDTVYSPGAEDMARAFEWRVLDHFGVTFGLVGMSEHEWGKPREAREVWAGPLLERVVRWRRGAGAGGEGGAGNVVEGPWGQSGRNGSGG